jgi:hypothetical protein
MKSSIPGFSAELAIRDNSTYYGLNQFAGALHTSDSLEPQSWKCAVGAGLAGFVLSPFGALAYGVICEALDQYGSR